MKHPPRRRSDESAPARARRGGVRAGALLLAAFALLASDAAAQGSAVYTQDACMNARNGAGIANPCDDGSAVYFNPAAIANRNGAVSLGVTVIDQGGEFTYDTSGVVVERQRSSTGVPHAWATYKLSPRLGVGVGLWAPYGLSLEWPACPKDGSPCQTNFEGRFVSYKHSLRGLYFQPTIAYQLVPGRISIGGGVDVVRGDVEINRRIDLADQTLAGAITFGDIGVPNNTDFADVKLSGDGWGVTGHVAALIRLSDAISIGARYMHEVKLDLSGDADFTQVPTGLTLPDNNPVTGVATPVDSLVASQFVGPFGLAADQGIKATFTLPTQAVVGVALKLSPELTTMFDVQWTQWSSWDSVVVDFDNAPDEPLILDYQDALTYRVGADYSINDRVLLHAGYSYNKPAAKDASVSPFLPDAERYFISGGVGFRVSERFSLNAFGMSAKVGARRGRVVNRESLSQTAEQLNEGLYTSTAQLFGATLTYHFGGAR